MQINIRREFKIAILVLIAGFILIWGLNFLRGASIFTSGTIYSGVFPSVEEINSGGPVNFKGFKVGYVKSISLYKEEPGMFLVTFVITEDLPITEGTVAELYTVDILGAKAIRILQGESDKVLPAGSILQTAISSSLTEQVSVEIVPLKNKAENMIVRLDTLLRNLNDVFSEENKEGISHAIKDLYQTMDNLNRTSMALNSAMQDGGSMGSALNNLENFTGALNSQSENLAGAIENIHGLTGHIAEADVAGMLARLDSSLLSLSTILAQMEQGEGSMGLLLKDETLYLNLTDATANLDRLLADVRQNPGRYVKVSAIDLGRNIYITDDESIAREKGIVFKVKIAESKEPLPIRNQLVLDGVPVSETLDGKTFIYTVGESSSYREALSILDRIKAQYPVAEIYALENNKPISLKKALRKLEIKD